MPDVRLVPEDLNFGQREDAKARISIVPAVQLDPDRVADRVVGQVEV